MAARRLLQMEQDKIARVKDPRRKEKSLSDYMKEDQALLSGEAVDKAGSSAGGRLSAYKMDVEEQTVRLADLLGRLKQNDGAEKDTKKEFQAVAYQHVTRTLEIDIESLELIDGLVVRNKQTAETDRYRFSFESGDTLVILDKWAGKSTRIWGDPHVDTDDQEGNRNGEFSDLKGSDSQTTFMLQDGTRLTFTAKDNGIIEAVDIAKGSQSVHGTGAGSSEWSAEKSFFDLEVKTAPLTVAMGDVVYAGGDGNDWFDASRQLLWGQTTGPIVTSRPDWIMRMRFNETIETGAMIQTRETQA